MVDRPAADRPTVLDRAIVVDRWATDVADRALADRALADRVADQVTNDRPATDRPATDRPATDLQATDAGKPCTTAAECDDGNPCTLDDCKTACTSTPVPACVWTLAGSGAPGSQNGQALQATFNAPHGIAVDSAGAVYVGDEMNHKIRRIWQGSVSTYAGSSWGWADGAPPAAKFVQPHGIGADSTGTIYVADNGNNRIRMVAPGLVSTLAGTSSSGAKDGPAAAATFKLPLGVTWAAGKVYVADSGNGLVRLIDGTVPGTATVSTIGNQSACTGPGFGQPVDVAVDAAGNVYVADLTCNRVKVISSGGTSLLAGSSNGASGFADGPGASALFQQPTALVLDEKGGKLYDTYNQRIRVVTLAGVTSTLAGDGTPCNSTTQPKAYLDGPASSARFCGPMGIDIGPDGKIYVGDEFNNRIRVINPP